MRADADYLTHFRARVLQDALSEATSQYWLKRADALEAARPRPGDFQGHATRDELAARDRRCATAAEACRRHASLWASAPEIEPIVLEALAEVAA